MQQILIYKKCRMVIIFFLFNKTKKGHNIIFQKLILDPIAQNVSCFTLGNLT